MEQDQLLDIFRREHDLLTSDIRLFVRTRLDSTLPEDTARQRERVLQFSSHVDARPGLFHPVVLARLRLSCRQMVEALDDYARQQRDPPLAEPSAVSIVPTGGRPRKVIDPEFLKEASTYRGPAGIARALGLCARTVRRQQLELGIGTAQPPVFLYTPNQAPIRNPASLQARRIVPSQPLSDDQLDVLVAELMNRFQNHGRSLIHGHLHGMGHNPTRSMITQSMIRITGIPGTFGRPRIRPKKYRVAGPGALWHHDGQHGLIHWGLILHAFVDGYLRRVMGLRMSNNNRSTTVLALFHKRTRRLD